MGSVNVNPIDIPEDSFEAEGGKFDPSKLISITLKKKKCGR